MESTDYPILHFLPCAVSAKKHIMKPINTATVRNHSLNPEFLPQELLRFPQILCRLFHTLWPLVFCCFKNSLPLSPFWFPTPSSSIAGKTRHRKPWEKPVEFPTPNSRKQLEKTSLAAWPGGFFFGLGENSSSFGWGVAGNPTRAEAGIFKASKTRPTQFNPVQTVEWNHGSKLQRFQSGGSSVEKAVKTNRLC